MGATGVEPTGTAELDEPVATAQKLGRYSLCFELASGGMASVYLARVEGPAGFEKLVALKRIHPHLRSKADFVEMFLDEARIASRVNHPNVCSVFDFGEADGTHYIAMEYILGETFGRLGRALARRDDPRAVGIVARIVADACEGLHAAHELRGDDGKLLDVVHRDVSPQNLFVAYDGTVRVVDFGIARAAGRIHETQSGTLKGKLSYIAPEQAKKLTLDRRADIWGLGVVAWELLCGRRLFKRESEVDTIMAVMTDDIPPPSSVRPGIPKELDAIVLHALARDRDARYPTARAMGRALNRFIATLPEPATSADVAELMEELFSVQLAKRRDLIERARRGAVGPVQRISRSLSSEDSGSDSAQSHSRAVASADALARSRRPGRNKVLAASVLAATALVGVVFALSGEDDAPATPALVLDEGTVEEASPAPEPSESAAAAEAAPEVSPPAERAAVTTEATTEATEPPATPEEPASLVDPTTPPANTPPAPPPGVPEAVTHRRARTRAPAAPAEPGWVDLATPGGWADVFRGVEHVGRAPGRVRVPAGRHTLVLRPFGRNPERRIVVRVPPGGGTRAVVDLR